MRRKLLWATGIAAIIIASCAYWWTTSADPPADVRARAYFGIPTDSPVDSVTLRAAVIRAVPLGTREPEVRARLVRAGIGADGLSSYVPSDSSQAAIVRIEAGRPLDWVARSYGIILQFNSAARLRDIHVHEWLTGP